MSDAPDLFQFQLQLTMLTWLPSVLDTTCKLLWIMTGKPRTLRTELSFNSVMPVTTVSWIHSKKKPQIEMKEIEDVEARISDLEVEIKLVRSAMIKNGNVSTTKRALIEE